MHPCHPGHLPQVPLTAHAVLWCSFQVLSTRSQYEQASGVQILAPEPKQVGVPWAPGGGITGHSQVFLRKLRTNTNTLPQRKVGLVVGRAFAFEKMSRPPASGQELGRWLPVKGPLGWAWPTPARPCPRCSP